MEHKKNKIIVKDSDQILINFPYFRNYRMCLFEKDFDKVFYFDAFDVIKMIKGIDASFTDWTPRNQFKKPEFDSKYFKSDKCFVHNLASVRAFSNKVQIQLLSHHLAEFYRNFSILLDESQNEDIHEKRVPKVIEKIKTIFTSVFGDNPDQRLLEFDLSTLDENKKEEYIKISKNNSESVFKVLGTYNLMDFKSRIRYFFKANTIESSIIVTPDFDEDLSLTEIKSDIFNKLIDSINKERPKSSRAKNYNDAFALNELYNKVKLFNLSPYKNSPIPILYDAEDKLFYRVVKSAGLEREFCVLINNRKHRVIRDSRYFIAKAIYRDLPESDAIEILNTLELFETSSNSIKIEELQTIENIIKNYFKINFIQDNLIRNKTLRNPEKLKEVLDPVSFYTKKEYKDELIKEVYFLKSKLEKSVKNIENIFELYSELTNRTKSLISKIKARSNDSLEGEFYKNVDAIDDLGIFRFSFSNVINNQIKKYVNVENGLLIKEANERERLIYLFCHYFVNREKSSIEDIKIKLGVLWIFELYDKIIEFTIWHHDKIKEDPSLLFIKGAAYFKQIPFSFYSQVDKIIDSLLLLNRKKNNSTEFLIITYKSLSYLYFHSWKEKNGTHLSQSIYDKKYDTVNNHDLIDKSIKYLKSARARFQREFGDDVSRTKENLYLLNIYIYYVSEGGNDTQFKKLEKEVQTLIKAKINPQSWQYRYNDTLARYYHRKSIITKKREDKLLAVQNAFVEINEAIQTSNGDQEALNYRTLLLEYISKKKLFFKGSDLQ